MEDWSPDGKYVIYNTRVPGQPIEIWALPLFGDRRAFPVAAAQVSCEEGQFSPDGKWVAYRSQESGSDEIFIQDFPPTGRKWQVSNGGGVNPSWRRDGKEVFYLQGKKLLAVDVKTDGRNFQAGAPHVLFEARIRSLGRNSYLPSPDGQKFLVSMSPPEELAVAITVVTNWVEMMKKQD
jgi:eukaryotic-like serine/threonine-protein kinase